MAWNLNKIKHHVRVPVMAVIKANAYGHGLLEVGQFLDKSRLFNTCNYLNINRY